MSRRRYLWLLPYAVLLSACGATSTGASGTPQPAHPVAIACDSPQSYQVSDGNTGIINCNGKPYIITYQYGDWQR